MSKELAEQLEALAEKATPGPLMMYGEPDVGLRTEPFFGTPMNGGMRPLADWRAYDADLVVALWNCLPSVIIALRAADQRCAELEAENARLREAIANQANSFNIVGSHYDAAVTALDAMVSEVKRNARTALGEPR